MTSSNQSSNLAFSRLLTTSNLINKRKIFQSILSKKKLSLIFYLEFSRDTSIYDNDDDRSPRTDQNISDQC